MRAINTPTTIKLRKYKTCGGSKVAKIIPKPKTQPKGR